MQPRLTAAILIASLSTLLPLPGPAQEAPSSPVPKVAPDAQQAASTAPSAPRLTLQQALDLARKNSTQLQAVLTEAGLAREDRVQARDSLLPGVGFTTSALYTQPNSLGGVKYIANNAPHEYVSQGNVHQQLDLASVASYRRTAALAAAAKARAEVASRGLAVTVVQDYFAVGAAGQKLAPPRT